MTLADINMEEIEFNITIFPAQKAHIAILLLYVILCDSAFNHVHTRSQASNLGDLLHSTFCVLPQYPPGTWVISIHRTIPSL